jgi:hypothetical protein
MDLKASNTLIPFSALVRILMGCASLNQTFSPGCPNFVLFATAIFGDLYAEKTEYYNAL